MFNPTKKRLGDILLESGLITRDQLTEAIAAQKATGKKLGEVLVEKRYVTKKNIFEVLEFQLGIPYINLTAIRAEASVIRLIPENMARKYEMVPVKLENGALTVAISDPLNLTAIEDARIYTGMEILPAIAEPEQIIGLISRHFSSKKALEAVEEFSKTNSLYTARSQVAATVENAAYQDVGESPAVKLVNILIEQACQSGASDIHIEPQDEFLRVRFRIDGQLQDVMKPEIDILPAIVSRIKVVAGLNIAEKRLPQDGRLTYKMGDKEIDLRVSVLPTVHGEKVVIRLISKETFSIPKSELGFLPENSVTFDSILKNPHGIVLVTGPTGSGKTTTLYAAIRELNKPNVNIVTVEDPVECIIDDINQVQVNAKAGLEFANSLRSILRQDPDIILIGEIRDSETAEIAVRAAITGHLVLSTLHTNDAASSIVRLIDMGVQPFLVSTSLVGVISQRLVRRICSNCKRPYEPTAEELGLFGDCTEKQVFYRGTGCQYCNGAGYKGRIAVHEVMRVGQEIRKAIYDGNSADRIRDIAISNGMITLRENCKRLVLQGMTTSDELLRVAYVQE